jgi:uncharacterized protein related to proFAR isomerase
MLHFLKQTDAGLVNVFNFILGFLVYLADLEQVGIGFSAYVSSQFEVLSRLVLHVGFRCLDCSRGDHANCVVVSTLQSLQE